MARVTGMDLSIDWTDLEQVKELARKLGPGMMVIKSQKRNQFNITHAEREFDLPEDTLIIYKT